MQTILGSGGAIGKELATALRKYTQEVKLVSRNPKKVHPGDKTVAADLLNSAAVKEAVRGSSVVYLTVGLEYNYKVWKRDWPVIISNVIEACKEEDCRLVFFDNMYMYEKNSLSHMTEDSKVIAPSKKGMVRAQIAEKIMMEVWTGSLIALIARSADFYGPGIKGNSILTETVFEPLSKGKKANWLNSADHKHSFTYVPDAAKGTALLGNTEDAYGQVWHLPTAPDPPTGQEWVERIAKEMRVKAGYRTIPKWTVQMLGIFMPVMRESVEMLYQYDRDYVFDSSKFEQRFGKKPTSYSQGIRETVTADYR